MNEATLVPHCDDGSCDLGVVQYRCPWCDDQVSDYEVWRDVYEADSTAVIDFPCADCRQLLRLRYVDFDWVVERREDTGSSHGQPFAFAPIQVISPAAGV